MILHLVTDRHRLAPLETRAGLVQRCLLSQARAAIAAGIDVVQVREPDLDAAVLRSLVADLVAMARGTVTQILVNDRLDVAIAAGASGVHLKETSAPVARVRALAPKGFLIGCSVHDEAAAHEAAPHADYLIAGSVYPTISKPARTSWLGVAGLAAIVRAVSVPVIGIGGITVDSIPDVARSGAAGVAGIGLFMAGAPGSPGSADVPCLATTLDQVTRALRAGFDTARRPS